MSYELINKAALTRFLSNVRSKIFKNNLTTTEEGYALDARQGKALKDSIDTINSNLSVISCVNNNGSVYKPIIMSVSMTFTNGSAAYDFASVLSENGCDGMASILFASFKTTSAYSITSANATGTVATITAKKVLDGSSYAGTISISVLIFGSVK